MEGTATWLLLLIFVIPCHGWECMDGPQHPGAMQIDAGNGQVVMRDQDSAVFLLSGSTWHRLGSVGLQHVSVGPAGIWGTDGSDGVYKYIAGDFRRSSGQNLHQVDAGNGGQVAGVTSSDTIHCLVAASSLSHVNSLSWSVIPGRLMYISCSVLGCWGVNSGHAIYFTRLNTCGPPSWIHVAGAAIKVEVGTDGSVFVVNEGGMLFQRAGVSAQVPQGTAWVHILMSDTVRHASYDQGFLWVVSNGGAILRCNK